MAAHRCRHCGKRMYQNYRVASRAARNAKTEVRIYWHPQGGGYALTHLSEGDYNRARAERPPA